MAVKKVTVNLPEEQVAFLQQMAERQHITVTDALRRAIETERFFSEQEASGSKVLIEDTKQQIKQVIRR
jgi:hypothetical protein